MYFFVMSFWPEFPNSLPIPKPSALFPISKSKVTSLSQTLSLKGQFAIIDSSTLKNFMDDISFHGFDILLIIDARFDYECPNNCPPQGIIPAISRM
jgi:hypothetical protein